MSEFSHHIPATHSPTTSSPAQERDMLVDPKTLTLLTQMKQNTESMNNEATRAFEYIREIERHLDEAAPGVETWSVLQKGKRLPTLAVRGRHFMIGIGAIHGNRHRQHATLVGYAKVGGKWGLAVAEGEVSVDSDERVSIRENTIGERRFLRDADRTTKILAVPRIPELIQALSEEIGRVAAEAKHTLDSNQ